AAAVRRAPEQPDQRLPSGVVVPEDVGKPVAVEVADAHDLPVECHGRRRAAADYRLADVLPRPAAPEHVDHYLPSFGVPPEDVAERITVEVAGAGDRPGACRPRRRRRGDALLDKAGSVVRVTVDQPHQYLAGGAVAPQDVVPSVAVEVALSNDLPV